MDETLGFTTHLQTSMMKHLIFHHDWQLLDLPTNCYRFIGFSMDEGSWIYHHKWMKQLDLPQFYQQL